MLTNNLVTAIECRNLILLMLKIECGEGGQGQIERKRLVVEENMFSYCQTPIACILDRHIL